MMSTSLNTRQEPKRLRIVLDWDGTVTKHDTLHIVAAIGYERNRHLNLRPWDQIVQAYISDYTRHEKCYRPSRPERRTIAQESAWLASLTDVEVASVKRARDAGIFRDVTHDDICKGAEHAIRSNKIQLRDGWKDIFAMADAPSNLNDLANTSPVSVSVSVSMISVNWSGAFIRACLSAAREGTADFIPIFSNHLQPDSSGPGVSEDSGIHTSADKLQALQKLRGSGSSPVFYVGDSSTDFDCLVSADVGVCVRDEPMSSGQAELKESLERVGIHVTRLDLEAWEKYREEIAGRGVENESNHPKVVWWVADLREVVSFADEYVRD